MRKTKCRRKSQPRSRSRSAARARRSVKPRSLAKVEAFWGACFKDVNDDIKKFVDEVREEIKKLQQRLEFLEESPQAQARREQQTKDARLMYQNPHAMVAM